ncbi:AsmA family protein [Alkalicaulis satelles]|nr:AsmA family protein [Alkalicaulis satelles]
MRTLFILLLLIAALIVGAALALPALISSDWLRDRVSQEASAAINREVRLDGAVQLRVFPRLQVRAEDASIANAPGFGDEPLAQMRELRASLAWGPLLSQRVEIEEFVLVEPVIRLEARADGNNWTLGAPREDAAPASASGEGFVRRPGALPFEAAFGDVRIENGSVFYRDPGQTRRIENLDLSVDLPSVDAPVRLSGSLSADDRPMRFTAELSSLRGFFEGAETALTLDMTGALADLRFNGRFLESETLSFDGRTNVDLPLPALARFLGTELPEGPVFRRFTAEADIAGSPGRLTLDQASIVFDDIRATGRLALDYERTRPMITGSLRTASLDITPYIPADETTGARSSDGAVGPWSEERMDLTALSTVDARLDVRADRFRARDIVAENVNLAVTLDNALLTARLTDFRLYGGQGVVTLAVNARQATPRLSIAADISALEALPFLTAAAGFDRLQGLGRMQLDLNGSGASPAALMRSLNGEGSFNFADGAIVGVNLAQVIRTVQQAVQTGSLPSGFADTQQTDFSALTGTFTVRQGVAQNLDLSMLSPLLRVEGSGTLNLAEQMIDYRLTPRAVQTLAGQGGDTNLQGLAVPVRIRGGFNAASVSVDLESVARDLVRLRAGSLIGGQAGQALTDGRRIEDVARDAATGALRDALGGRQRESEEGQEETRDDPARRLLEGVLGRRPQPRQEPEPESDDDGR